MNVVGCARKRQENFVPRSPRYRERNTRDTSRSLLRRVNARRPRGGRGGLADVAETHARLVLGARSKRVRTVWFVLFTTALYLFRWEAILFFACRARAAHARRRRRARTQVAGASRRDWPSDCHWASTLRPPSNRKARFLGILKFKFISCTQRMRIETIHNRSFAVFESRI